MVFYYGEKKNQGKRLKLHLEFTVYKSMNCVSEITDYVRAMKQSAFYPFCPHPHFILFVRILSFLSAFYPFCPHFILFVPFYPFFSASAFYPFCPHSHFIPFVRIRILSLLSASAFYPFCPSVRLFVPVSVRPSISAFYPNPFLVTVMQYD
jgi:hypothetical protein